MRSSRHVARQWRAMRNTPYDQRSVFKHILLEHPVPDLFPLCCYNNLHPLFGARMWRSSYKSVSEVRTWRRVRRCSQFISKVFSKTCFGPFSSSEMKSLVLHLCVVTIWGWSTYVICDAQVSTYLWPCICVGKDSSKIFSPRRFGVNNVFVWVSSHLIKWLNNQNDFVLESRIKFHRNTFYLIFQ